MQGTMPRHLTNRTSVRAGRSSLNLIKSVQVNNTGEGFFFDGCSPSRSRRPQLTSPNYSLTAAHLAAGVDGGLKRALEPDLRPHPRKGAPGKRRQDRWRTGFVSDGASKDDLVRYGSAVKRPGPRLNTEVSFVRCSFCFMWMTYDFFGTWYSLKVSSWGNKLRN